MKRKCINCKHYDNGYRNYGENGYDFENASCMLGIKNANYFDDNEEKDFSCTLSQKEFDLRTKLADIEDANYYNGWEVQGLKEDIEHYKEQIQQLKSEQNKVAVEKLEELRARFDNSPIIFFHDTELNEKERAIVRDEYEDAKFIFRDNIDQLLAELKGESDDN